MPGHRSRQRKYATSGSARVKALSNAIYQQEEVLKQLSSNSEDIQTVGNSGLITTYVGEASCGGQAGGWPWEFNPEANIDTLYICPGRADAESGAMPPRAACELYGATTCQPPWHPDQTSGHYNDDLRYPDTGSCPKKVY